MATAEPKLSPTTAASKTMGLFSKNVNVNEYQKSVYNKIAEKRAKEFIRQRRNARVMGLGLTGVVIAIYSYTIYRMGQEKFLDDNEPLQKTIP